MLNIANYVNSWLKTQIVGLPDIYNDAFPDKDGDLIIARHEASQSSARDFGDGTRLVEASYSYYARCANAQDCRRHLEAILATLENAQLIRPSDDVSFQCEGVSLPQFIETDDKGQTIYMMSVIITYLDGQERP